METCIHYNNHWDFSKLKGLDTLERNKAGHVTETKMAASVKKWINRHCHPDQESSPAGLLMKVMFQQDLDEAKQLYFSSVPHLNTDLEFN